MEPVVFEHAIGDEALPITEPVSSIWMSQACVNLAITHTKQRGSYKSNARRLTGVAL